MDISIVIYCIVAYLLGSVPTAVWYGKFFFNIDVRQHGSGNAGATNTLRVLGNKAGLLVFAIDFLKGFLATKLPVWITLYNQPEPGVILRYQMMFGICALIGHIFPLF